MAIVNAVGGSELQIPETGSLGDYVSNYVATVRAGLTDGTLVRVETRRERIERLQLDVERFARHVLSALILYVVPAGIVFVVARGLRRHVRGGAR